MMSLRVRSGLIAAGAALALSAASPASAASIVGLYDTGVDNFGNVLANGTPDLHYTIQSDTNPNFVSPAPAFITAGNASWIQNDLVGSQGSSWISFNPLGLSGKLGGQPSYSYDYVLTFNLGSLSAASATLSGRLASDNVVRVLLNGFDIGGQDDTAAPLPSSYFKEFSAFGAGGGFQAGTNELRFRVTDLGISTGLRVDNLVGTAVPEPGVWAMLIIGFGVVASQIRRRRRAGPLAIA